LTDTLYLQIPGPIARVTNTNTTAEPARLNSIAFQRWPINKLNMLTLFMLQVNLIS